MTALIRFNRKFMEWLGTARLELFGGKPLGRGFISAHVRHGDKGTEMRLVPFQDYFAAAVRLVKANPWTLRKALFVSTEGAF